MGKISNLTNIFQMGWFNHQLEIAFEQVASLYTEISRQVPHELLPSGVEDEAYSAENGGFVVGGGIPHRIHVSGQIIATENTRKLTPNGSEK